MQHWQSWIYREMLSKIPEQIMKDWLAKKQADKCRHDIEIMNNDIQHTEAMIDESRRGETAWKPEEMYPFLEDLNIRLLKRTTELPKIKELERCSAISTVLCAILFLISGPKEALGAND